MSDGPVIRDHADVQGEILSGIEAAVDTAQHGAAAQQAAGKRWMLGGLPADPKAHPTAAGVAPRI